MILWFLDMNSEGLYLMRWEKISKNLVVVETYRREYEESIFLLDKAMKPFS